MKELLDIKNNNSINEQKEKENDNDYNDEYKDFMSETGNFKKIPIIENNEIIIKDAQYYKKQLIKFLKKSPIIIAFLLVYLLYFLSLEGCYEGEGV